MQRGRDRRQAESFTGNMPRTRGGQGMPTSLKEIAKQAEQDPKRRFTNLHQHLNRELLIDSFRRLNKRAARGVDGVSAARYGEGLEANVADLLRRVRQGTYRARLVRRRYIQKSNGKLRPLGIPTIEDKLLQLAVGRILSAVYEQDFLPTSYGYRPKRGAKEAICRLTDEVGKKYSYVVEADIKGFFDHLDHEWLLRMLNLRIGDGVVKRLIRKWLKAGILMEDGSVERPEEGTPQGGVISPILANVYLHYALDLWFEKVIRRHCQGEAYLIRYADDFVALFRYKQDAEMFYQTLGARLGKFNLTLAEEKTRIISFSRFRKYERTSFIFLGVEFRWGTSRNNKDIIKRCTSRKKMQRAFAEFTEWCRENRNQRIRKQAAEVTLKLKGHYNYFGLAGNYRCLAQYFSATMRIWYRWLNRRSQRRSYNWAEFTRMTQVYEIPRPRITEQWTRYSWANSA